MAGDEVGVLLEDYSAFGEWLVSHEDDVVGMTQDCVACPLAAWLDEVVGGEWQVTPSRCQDSTAWEAWPLPAWARMFVEEVDRRYGWCRFVTGGMALFVLREAVW